MVVLGIPGRGGGSGTPIPLCADSDSVLEATPPLTQPRTPDIVPASSANP